MPTDAGLPYLVPLDWYFHRPVGQGKSLNYYQDGTVRFEHRCDRGDRGVIICAPLLQLDGGHTIDREAVTVSPSILCSDCGTHGFVRRGVWEAA